MARPGCKWGATRQLERWSPGRATCEVRAVGAAVAGACSLGAGQIGIGSLPLIRSRPCASPSLKKALGQHHLVDGALCRPLIDFLAPRGQRVLEIGPGGGVLTAELLARRRPGDRLGAGPRLGRPSCAAGCPIRGCRLVVGDALEIAWERLPGADPGRRQPALQRGDRDHRAAAAAPRAGPARRLPGAEGGGGAAGRPAPATRPTARSACSSPPTPRRASSAGCARELPSAAQGRQRLRRPASCSRRRCPRPRCRRLHRRSSASPSPSGARPCATPSPPAGAGARRGGARRGGAAGRRCGRRSWALAELAWQI